MGSKAFESPLISHARMRALYRGLVELQGLAQHRKDRSFRGTEACWVASAIDLRDGDLVCDTGGANEAALLEHVRAVGRRAAGSAVQRSELKRVAETMVDGFPGNAFERLLCAVGSAMAMKAGESDGVVLAFARADELSAREWVRVLTVMRQQGLPLIVMVLPGKSVVELEPFARRAAGGKEAGVPVIPVDAGDAVAIYRVAQETMVRARMDGGAAVIEGVAFRTDAVKLLGGQLVKKRICTERWVQGVEMHLMGLLKDLRG